MSYQILRPRELPKLVSFVFPMFNEFEMLPLLRQQMEAFLATLSCPAEVVLVNDGSSDRTLDLVTDWARDDFRIKVVSLARNFGHQVAATAGLDHASGDAVILMDADLQDPLAVIDAMLRKYCEGYDVVYGQRNCRAGETCFKKFTGWAFYRLMQRFVHRALPVDTGDFRLISRPCLDALCSMREQHRFLRGMVAWVGFAQTAVRYDREARAAGTSKYTLAKMVRFAWTAIVSFSSLPLTMSSYLGAMVTMCGTLVGGFGLWQLLIGDGTVSGSTVQMTITLLVGGAILLSNGVLGAYVGRIFEELKQRPLYVVSHRENLASDATVPQSHDDGVRLPSSRLAVFPPTQDSQPVKRAG